MNSRQRDWALFAAATFLYGFGFAIYNGLFQNYFFGVIRGKPGDLGVLESLRETPGLLTAFTASALVTLAEPRLGSLALIVSAFGIAATGHTTTYWPLVAVTVFWSVGMHLWFSLSPGITLALADGKEGGRHLGRMASVGSIAVLVALGATRLAKPYVPYRVLFDCAGGLILLAGCAAALLSARAGTRSRAGLLFRREYSLFYVLTFLEGCRRQVFGTFASFVLIAVYRVPVEVMLTLSFANAAVAMFTSPLIGRAIDRYGERRTLTAYYCALIAVFSGYALIGNVKVLYGLYLVDSLLFAFALALTTYLHRTVRPGDLTASLTMGTTMNHVAAVVVPVAGGVLWQRSGNFQIPFAIGVAVLVMSLWATRQIPDRPTEPSRADAPPAS